MENTMLHLSATEKELLLRAPAMVTVLVAGSDGDFKENEIERGIDITDWKRIHARPDLMGYYDQVRPRFRQDISQLRQQLPKDINERYRLLSDQLKQLNPILYKLDQPIAEQLYASLRELAQHVAEASGGVLGYFSVGYNESKVITLPMIDDPRIYRV
jgi:hypothetical protein